MIPLLADHTLRTVALGSAILGAVSGALGSFALLRRQSLLGDAVSHAALPGIAAAYLIASSKAPLVLMAGAAGAGFAATLAVGVVVSRSRVRFDAALGIALATFFGAGLVMLSLIQKRPDASQAGLDRFLFGQAAALLEEDVRAMALLGGLALLSVLLFWKEFKLLAFDPDFAGSLGLPRRRLDVALTALLVVAVVIGLAAVGVVLMSAMIVGPAAAARQWSRRLGPMVLTAALFGAGSGVGGALLSSTWAKLPTGPTIVLVMTGWVALSLVLGPSRGLLWRHLRRRRSLVSPAAVLDGLQALARQHRGEEQHAHAEAVLRALTPGRAGVSRALARLEREGLVRRAGEGRWALTARGRDRAARRREQNGAGR